MAKDFRSHWSTGLYAIFIARTAHRVRGIFVLPQPGTKNDWPCAIDLLHCIEGRDEEKVRSKAARQIDNTYLSSRRHTTQASRYQPSTAITNWFAQRLMPQTRQRANDRQTQRLVICSMIFNAALLSTIDFWHQGQAFAVLHPPRFGLKHPLWTPCSLPQGN